VIFAGLNSMILEMFQVFDIDPGSCLRVSAKTGMGLDEVLPAIIERMPHPVGNERGNLRMLLFDAVHDEYRCVLLPKYKENMHSIVFY